MEVKTIKLPIGPGRGESGTVQDAVFSLMSEMRGHTRDLKDSGEETQAELLDKYVTALWIIHYQISERYMFGIGLPSEMVQKAIHYRLDLPTGRATSIS
jgi:hypothetical protein